MKMSIVSWCQFFKYLSFLVTIKYVLAYWIRLNAELEDTGVSGKKQNDKNAY